MQDIKRYKELRRATGWALLGMKDGHLKLTRELEKTHEGMLVKGGATSTGPAGLAGLHAVTP
jgi:hypothetical protein